MLENAGKIAHFSFIYETVNKTWIANIWLQQVKNKTNTAGQDTANEYYRLHSIQIRPGLFNREK